jgi:hypothetical protein
MPDGHTGGPEQHHSTTRRRTEGSAMKARILVLYCLAGAATTSVAEAIKFRDYRLLQKGMSEAEIPMRAGPPDCESVVSTQYLYKKIWCYVPDGSYSGDWLTIITIGPDGKVINIEGTRP